MKNETIKNLGYGLNPLPHDERDFSLAGVFGAPNLTDIPFEFVVALPRFMKDQRDLDDCTGNGTTSASEDQETQEGELSEEYQFFLTKMLILNDPDSFGADLRSACKSLCEYGSIPKSLAYKYLKNRYDRREILDKATWPQSLLIDAKPLKKGSFFKIDGPHDIFDNIRAALWQHHEELSTAVVGCKWRTSWTYADKGIIPKEYEFNGFGHCFKIFGVKIVNEEPHLMAQLSNGEAIGDKGIFYFSREIVNREFGPYGQFMFKDMPKDDAAYYHENKIMVCDQWFVELWKVFKNILLSAFKK